MLTRRTLLASGLALGAGLALDPLIRPLSARPRRPGRLDDIDHVVIMMQENRSFDHYFGRLRGVRGFGDRSQRSTFAQPDGQGGTVYPFHVDAKRTGGGCTVDPIHLWAVQHESVLTPGTWVTSHEPFNHADSRVVMSYFDGRDIPYFYGLARAFTVCDRYFCSVMGPTDPNRAYSMTATMDPDGKAGGPLMAAFPSQPPAMSWTTMPEQLEARGISWKVYSAADSTFMDGDNTLFFFKQYHANPVLMAKGIAPVFTDFLADAAAGSLPQVSWVIAPTPQLEHPRQSTPVRGEYVVNQVVSALTARADRWAHTVLFLTYDENGGFFDHVTPPTAPPGTPGEFLTVDPLPALAQGVAGPVGLGPRARAGPAAVGEWRLDGQRHGAGLAPAAVRRRAAAHVVRAVAGARRRRPRRQERGPGHHAGGLARAVGARPGRGPACNRARLRARRRRLRRRGQPHVTGPVRARRRPRDR